MDKIESEVIEGFKALPPRGAEVGGALLGERDPVSGDFTIQGIQPLDLDTSSGLGPLRDQVHGLRLSTPRFIGLYRSQTRPGLHVTPEDCTLVEALLPREEGVLLLVKPLSEESLSGAFFLCDGGAIVDAATGAREFPFGVGRRPRKPSSLPKWIPLSAAALGIAAALLVHYRNPLVELVEEDPVPPAATLVAAPAALHFRSESRGQSARLEWDKTSPALLNAAGVSLAVAYGNTRTAHRLTPLELSRGYIDWRLRAHDTRFDLRVDPATGPPVIESVNVVNSVYPINSSSDNPPAVPVAKPGVAPRASAATGESPESSLERSAPLASKTQRPGRIRRFFGGVTAKASHLWPFHPASPER